MRKNPISKSEIERVDVLVSDIKSGNLIISHPLQRYSQQWGAEQKGNFIRRVLHDGRFLPILICTQYDEHGCEVRYLIDGVQRLTAFESFMNDGFAISQHTLDYIVDYDGILYETKPVKSGKFVLKRDRNKNLIPILDENGEKQRRSQSIDIRGLKYSELPPELQEKIKGYKVSVELKLECTDEDIQIEILDYNNGTKMNDAQIGKNRLGAEFAKIVIELSNHPFIKNKCGFTQSNRTKGVIDRAINEALMLANFGAEDWVTNHKDLCRKLSNWLSTEHTENLKIMFDELDEIIPENDKIKEYLKLKEFFVVIANYAHFRDLGYKKESYAKFLDSFVSEIQNIKNLPTGEVDDDGNEVFDSYRNVYMNGTRQKGNVESRLADMNRIMEEYFEANGVEKDETEENFSLLTAPAEIIDFAQNFIDDETAVKCLSLCFDNLAVLNLKNSEKSDFSAKDLKNTLSFYKKTGNIEVLDNILRRKDIVTGCGIKDDDKNLPLYVYAVSQMEKWYDFAPAIDAFIPAVETSGFKSEKLGLKLIEIDEKLKSNRESMEKITKQAV